MFDLKKVLSVCLILIMTAGLFSFTGREAYAKTAGKDDRFSEGGFIFEITDADKKYVMVTGIDPAGKNDSKDKENIILPAEVIHKELTYTVTGIGDAAFAMTGIVSVSIPEGIMAIGDSAFAGCEKLKRVELPASLNRIGNGVFSYCKILDDIVIDDDSEDFIYIKGLLSSVDREKLYWASNSIAGNLTLPEKTVEIMPYAFEGNTSLKKVVMKDGLTSIGKGAFFDCNALTRADIPKTVGSIDGNPFMYCTSLKKIKVNSKNANYRSTSAGLLLNAKKTVLISASAARGSIRART